MRQRETDCDLAAMKPQDPFFTSSSRRETCPDKNVGTKHVGCISGLLRLVYKYQNRRRFLTLGKKQDKNNTKPSSPTETKQIVTSSSLTQIENSIKGLHARFSCDVPRSPTLPPEIRRSNSLNTSEPFKTPPSVVARLMGLNNTMPPAKAESSVAEKRRKLLGALEKCDEDLKTLKKIIEMVKQVGESKRCDNNNDMSGYDRRGNCGVTGRSELQPSPVSVLDEFTRSAFTGYSTRYINGVPQQLKKKPGEEDLLNVNFIDRITTEMIKVKTEDLDVPLWTSKAMVDSLNEVCKDVDWGERREIGRIGLSLQDLIFRDLIDDVVKEMGCAFNILPLPFESCKRRLPF